MAAMASIVSMPDMPLDLHGVDKKDYNTLLRKARTKYKPDEYYFSVDEDSTLYWVLFGDAEKGYDINIMRTIVDYSEKSEGYDNFIKNLFFLQIEYLKYLEYWKDHIEDKLLATLGESLGRRLTYRDRNFIMEVNNLRYYDAPAKHYLSPRGIISVQDVDGDFLGDNAFLLTFANHDSDVLTKATNPSRELVLACVKHYGVRLQYAGEYRSDREIVRLAVLGPPEFQDNARKRGRDTPFGKSFGRPAALAFASDDIKNDKAFVFELFMEFERRFFRKEKYGERRNLYKSGEVPKLSEIVTDSISYDQVKKWYYYGEDYGGVMDARNVDVGFITNAWGMTYHRHTRLDWQEGSYRDFLKNEMLERLIQANSLPSPKRRRINYALLRF